MVKYQVLCHSSIRIQTDKEIIYFDPFRVKGEPNDASLIFITHPHYDHFSIEDIKKVDNGNTLYVMPLSMKKEAVNLPFKRRIMFVEPSQNYQINTTVFSTIVAYNVNKPFHKREYGWVGYILSLEGKKYYVMGDTDDTIEAENVRADVVFAPIGGTYTMDGDDAAACVNKIHPSVAVPIHYGSIVGDKKEASRFASLLDAGIASDIEL